MNDRLLFQIALSHAPKIGDINAKKLIRYCGSAENIFNESRRALLKIPGIGATLANNLLNGDNLRIAEKEMAFIRKYGIKPLFFTDPDYPERLKQCADSPVLLFVKGKVDFESPRVLSIVGTRNATEYGKELCRKLIEDLHDRNHDPVIVSGLAYGIDIHAHKAALNNSLSTVAVLAHGLNSIYPPLHRSVATQITGQGALVTDFLSFQKAEKPNFIKRNRIIAGIADATVVIESGAKGGALITADIANSYSRDVFAFPGKVSDIRSVGCNKLIKTNKAALIESVLDLEYIMNWEPPSGKTGFVQQKLFAELTDEEQKMMALLNEGEMLSIDHLSHQSGIPLSQISTALLDLEFKGLIKSLPGKFYKTTL